MDKRKSTEEGVDRFILCLIILNGNHKNLDNSPVIATQRQDNGSQGIDNSIPCFFIGGLDNATK